MARRPKSERKTIRIQQTKSAIGYNKKQKLTIRALGIRRLGQVVVHKDTPQIRGMVQKVLHLVKVVEQ